MRGSRLREVVAKGGSTVVCLSFHNNTVVTFETSDVWCGTIKGRKHCTLLHCLFVCFLGLAWHLGFL